MQCNYNIKSSKRIRTIFQKKSTKGHFTTSSIFLFGVTLNYYILLNELIQWISPRYLLLWSTQFRQTTYICKWGRTERSGSGKGIRRTILPGRGKNWVFLRRLKCNFHTMGTRMEMKLLFHLRTRGILLMVERCVSRRVYFTHYAVRFAYGGSESAVEFTRHILTSVFIKILHSKLYSSTAASFFVAFVLLSSSQRAI